MRWLALSLAGPTLWALMFVVLYALHGVACAGAVLPESLSSGARWGLVAVWGAGLAAHVGLLRALPRAGGLPENLPRAGAWIGLGATAFTLFPVALLSSC
ncbi:hypothetical protein [Roseinatronobacter sp.]